LLDGEHSRISRGATQKVEHRTETVKRVVQQDVFLPDHGQQIR
jgi:hypothetical protein